MTQIPLPAGLETQSPGDTLPVRFVSPGKMLDYLDLEFLRHRFEGADDIVDQPSLFVRRHQTEQVSRLNAVVNHCLLYTSPSPRDRS